VGLTGLTIVSSWLLVQARIKREQSEQETKGLEQTLLNVHRNQAQLVQQEKMVSLGQLVAGVAHEINNPVNFIHGNLKYTHDYAQGLLGLIELYQKHYPTPNSEILAEIKNIDLEFIQDDLPKLLASMDMGAERIREIVLSLRNFSRMDESESKTVNIHEGIDSTLLILQHRLNQDFSGRIEVIRNYGDLPPVECFPGQLNQVFMNLLVNGIDALEEMAQKPPTKSSPTKSPPTKSPPTPSQQLVIETTLLDQDWIEIAIIDNGPGMSLQVQKQIFDPFFTTKPVGKGTGMGLAISYQIVTEKHGGQLKCFSTPGKGTKFSIQIPLRQII
jgi:signal transduction histidine kinase